MTLRTSFIGHENRKNSRGLLQWILNSHGTITGYANCLWNGVTCLQLAQIVDKIIQGGSEGWYDNGVYHIHSPDQVNKYDICRYVNELYNVGLNVQCVRTRKFMGAAVNGTLNRCLSSNFELTNRLEIPEIYTQIKEQKEWHESQ